MDRIHLRIGAAGVVVASALLVWVAFAVSLAADPPSFFDREATEETPAQAQTFAVVGETLLDSGDAPEAAALWTRFATLVPPARRAGVVSFGTTADAGTSGYVEPVKGDLTRWHVAFHPDLLDAPQDLDFVIVHELAHLITLAADQVATVSSRVELRTLADTCGTYFTGDGCTRVGSYLTAWTEEFWPEGLLAEWAAAEGEEGMRDFVRGHPEAFVSDYAATSPSEDIAETFAEYVLGTGHDHLGDVAKAKLAFFDRYPELVELKTAIRVRR